MHPPSDSAEVAYVAIFAFAGLLWLIGMVRSYGWLSRRWPRGVWFRRRPCPGRLHSRGGG
jgi:hypothetical protein